MPVIKVPPQIMVGAHPYRIVLRNSDRLTDEGVFGEVNHRTQTIEIRADRPPSQCLVSLLHEFIHTSANVFSKDGLEEKFIDPIAQGLGQILSQLGIELDWTEVKE